MDLDEKFEEKEKTREDEDSKETGLNEPSAHELEAQTHLLHLAEWRFLYSLPNNEYPNKADIQAKILALVQEKNMAPYYKQVCAAYQWKVDEQLVAKMEKENKAELDRLEKNIVDAEANLGETEVREGKLARAEFLSRIGDKEKAVQAYNDTLEKTVGSGQRIDLVLALIRLALAFSDTEQVRAHIEKAKSFVEKGGDWERRNRLKVYEAVYLVTVRDFKPAATLLLDSIATYTCTELFSYNQFIFYTVVMCVVAKDRVTLRNKVVKAPEILTVIRDIPNLEQFLFSLYGCKYREFFAALSGMTTQLKQDRYLAPHFNYLLREIRIVAYTQFLESYRSVTLKSMAASFGISVAFLDKELSRFISAGRLNCKIDKVGGIVETNRPDAKNAQYQETIKQGDFLLNRIQKLSKVISY